MAPMMIFVPPEYVFAPVKVTVPDACSTVPVPEIALLNVGDPERQNVR
ncbi:MAG: hypothetical protein M5R36_27145 [Deltaproteobacteria bacterium]|nr:hypothetical protein [Deltaproteobacteria bacterium]